MWQKQRHIGIVKEGLHIRVHKYVQLPVNEGYNCRIDPAAITHKFIVIVDALVACIVFVFSLGAFANHVTTRSQ